MSESSLPPPPTKGNSGAMVVVALVLLLASGGLLYWKATQEEPTAELQTASAVAPPQAVPAAPSPVLNTAPPPPPPPPAEEATPSGPGAAETASGAAGSAVGAAPVSACEAVCNGTPPAALQSALASRARQARACYQNALRQDATLQGKLLIGVKISKLGSACAVSVQENTLGNPSVVNCVLGKFQGGGYPKPEGGCANTQVPINFVSK